MKTREFHFRMEEETNAILESLSQQTGLKRAEILCRLIHSAPIRTPPPADYTALLAALRAIGVNMNQIARVANSTGEIKAAEYERAAASLSAAILSIRQAVELC